MVFHISVFLIGISSLSIHCNGVLSQELIVTPEDITLFLYTRSNRDEPQFLRSSNLTDLSNSNFNSSLPNYIVFHGVIDNYRSSLYIKDPLLSVADVNLFLVDYSRPASSMDWYTEATIRTAQIMAEYINLIKNRYKVSSDHIILVGFSLGCHVAGEIGRLHAGDISTIIALDPAGISPSYIDSDKAGYVQAIHSSSVGLQTPAAHVDFFANSNEQPGCNGDFTCNHFRATVYYAESLATGGFSAVKCDSYRSFELGLCSMNERSHLGGIELDTRARGLYYLMTNGQPPYSIGGVGRLHAAISLLPVLVQITLKIMGL